jgi:tripartite-type tricarboxylate transporter receptor subunit TctC
MGTQSGFVLNRAARKSLPFDPEKDFTPITNLFTATMYLYSRPGLPVSNLSELIALAKSKPGALTFASIGPGTSSHLSGELLKRMAGIDMLHVPYKGGPEADSAVMAGQVDIMFDGGNALNQMMRRDVHVLGVGSLRRATNLPNIPTLDESGLKGYNVAPWFGLFAPAGTPKAIIDKLNAEIVPILKSADMRDRAAPQGLEITPSTPEELGKLLKTDYPVWEKIMRQAGIEPE